MTTTGHDDGWKAYITLTYLQEYNATCLLTQRPRYNFNITKRGQKSSCFKKHKGTSAYPYNEYCGIWDSRTRYSEGKLIS